MPRDEDKTVWQALREPFPPEQIGHIPKAGKQFAFVSHGHVTERLLDHAPDYEFHIRHFFSDGLEADASVGVIAAMTIGGLTREEVGNGKNVKDAVSDAFKRCAMRFGVALDLWVGEDLTSANAPQSKQFQAPKPQPIKPDEEALKLTGTLMALADDYSAEAAVNMRRSINQHLESDANLAAHKAWLKRGIEQATKRLEDKALGTKV